MTDIATGALLVQAQWMVAADPLGVDKALHVLFAAALVVVLRRPLGRLRAAMVVLAAGVALEIVHGSVGSLGFDLPPPVGGTAELADVVADLVGIGLGLAITSLIGPGSTRLQPRAEPEVR